MPLQRLNKKAWEIEFQRAVSSIDENCGLTVTRSKIGNVELRHRGQGFNVVKTIPFKWEENWGDAYTRIRNIFKFITEGHNLKAAAELAQGKAPKKGKDWAHILESFKDQKINFGTAITEATFNKQYLPPCEMVVDVMSKKNPPTNPADLIDICVKDWKPQSVSRKHRVRAIKQFLDHAVIREGIADIWTPPTDLSSHIGKAKKGEIQIQKAGAFESDIQILDFLKTLPTDSDSKKDADAATRWFNCFCLMAELGLRPIEINFLQVLFDPINKEHYWHCTFITKAGNGATQPRRIEPLPLIDRDGNEVKWNLMERFKSNLLPLPERVTGEAAGTYLKRRESWIQLKADMKRLQGTNITCYSFRHYYALRCHLKLIDSGSASLSMGHSIEAHHRNYPYSKESTTTNAFKLARERSVAMDLRFDPHSSSDTEFNSNDFASNFDATKAPVKVMDGRNVSFPKEKKEIKIITIEEFSKLTKARKKMATYLEERIKYYAENYKAGNALISDAQFDQLEKNLRKISPNCDYFNQKI